MLTMSQSLILNVIIKESRKGTPVKISHREISKRTGIHMMYISSYISNLCTSGHIIRTNHGSGTTNTYELGHAVSLRE